VNESREYDFIVRQAKTNPDISRRRLMKWLVKSGMGVTAASFLSASAVAGCGSNLGAPTAGGAGGGGGDGFGGGKDTLRIGAISVFEGIGSFLGAITRRSLDTAVAQINRSGGIGGRKVSWEAKGVTASDPQAIQGVYNDLASGDYAGIVWAAPGGVVELQDAIARDQMPIGGAFIDLVDSGEIYPKNQNLRSVFQFLTPDSLSMEVLAEYVANDRGYRRVGLVYLSEQGDEVVELFRKAMGNVGVSVEAVASFSVTDADMTPQLNQMRGAQSIWIWGIAETVAQGVGVLKDQNRDYIDKEQALSAARPHLMGSPAATGERKWAELAEKNKPGSPKSGTMTAWHVGGLIYLPTFNMRKWMQELGEERPTGGEETPADALFTVVNGIQKAKSADRAQVIQAIEKAGPIKFASVEFEFTEDRHAARTKDDVILVTFERGAGPASPDYQLGREYTGPDAVFDKSYYGPTHLVRPTVEANKRKHPEVMKIVVDEGWGVNCPQSCRTH
jgi:ABC-type branched-subunit amino acid transport system substrate-binding protein